jgi:protein disulfide-isomerase
MNKGLTMKSVYLFFACAFVASFCGVSKANASQINWMTNYDEALNLSRSTSKPLVLLFTGSDWCTWCIKLEKEALATPEFAQIAGDRFIFVKLDFPLNRTQPPEISAQNKRLQKQFDVSGFPMVVLVDPSERRIGQTGYRPGGGRAFGQYLLKMIGEHAAYTEKLDKLHENQNFSGQDLRALYTQATELKRNGDAAYIAEVGVESDQKHFFLLERYRLLVEQGQGHTEEAKLIRQQLSASDPHNFKLIQYQMALIDFETRCNSSHATTPETVVASLVDYIQKFGEQDKDHLWRLQMLISQVFLEDEKFSEALKYAQSSYQSAPPTAQPEIATAIHNLEVNLSSH